MEHDESAKENKNKSLLDFLKGFPGIVSPYLLHIAVAMFVGVAIAWLVSNAVGPLREVLVERQLVNVLLFLLVVNAIFYLDRVARQLRVPGVPGIVRVSPDQYSDTRPLVDQIEKLSAQKARLLEFSGFTALALIEELLQKGWEVDLLVKHPESVGWNQGMRIRTVLDDLERRVELMIGQAKQRLHVRCYRASASLRGRKLGEELVNLGWYTPTSGKDPSGGPLEVVGDVNPLITARLDAPECCCFGRMFDRLFDELWDDKTTEDADWA